VTRVARIWWTVTHFNGIICICGIWSHLSFQDTVSHRLQGQEAEDGDDCSDNDLVIVSPMWSLRRILAGWSFKNNSPLGSMSLPHNATDKGFGFASYCSSPPSHTTCNGIYPQSAYYSRPVTASVVMAPRFAAVTTIKHYLKKICKPRVVFFFETSFPGSHPPLPIVHIGNPLSWDSLSFFGEYRDSHSFFGEYPT